MANRLLGFAALLGFLGVILGAFGAHALVSILTPEQLHSFRTGVEYQITHAVTMLVVAVLIMLPNQRLNISMLTWSGRLLGGGVVLFSGSIYLLVFGGPKWLGPITPLGGLCMIMGWLLLGCSTLFRKTD